MKNAKKSVPILLPEKYFAKLLSFSQSNSPSIKLPLKSSLKLQEAMRPS